MYFYCEYYHSHFPDGETEKERVHFTCLRTQAGEQKSQADSAAHELNYHLCESYHLLFNMSKSAFSRIKTTFSN